MNAEKMAVKQRIIDDTLQAKARNEAAIAALKDSVSLDEYVHLTRECEHGRVWTEALAAAVREHEIVVIPASDEVYWIDKTVFIPSNTHIEATGAKIRLVPEYPYVMLANEHVHDGTYAPIDTSDRDVNISIHGGSWEECSTKRGERKFHADKGSFFGVQALLKQRGIFDHHHHAGQKHGHKQNGHEQPAVQEAQGTGREKNQNTHQNNTQ